MVSCLLSFCCVSLVCRSSASLPCRLNLPSFPPPLGLSVTALLFAVFSQSFPWLPPHYSSLSLQSAYPHTLLGFCLPALFLLDLLPIGNRTSIPPGILYFLIFSYISMNSESRNFIIFTSVCLVPRPLPAF